LVKRFDLALQFDAVDQVDRDRHMLAAQRVQEGILQKLTFVAHDILRVQKLERTDLTTGPMGPI
jgi:hypothetical protein